ncbi:MAG: response regulator transcription factor [Planctomycetota bacterium]|jgi:FixJ family two-component response regulator
MEIEPTVFIVDDDEAVRQSLQLLAESVGLKATCFAKPLEFLDQYDPALPGCLVLDIRMPEMSGLELKAKLAERKIEIPVIFLTGHGDVDMGVGAMKTGAVDFIQKPPNDEALLDSIQKAIQQDAERRRRSAEREGASQRLASLTRRERQIMELLVQGQADKQIAHELGISIRAVGLHRRKILDKVGVASVVELTRLVVKFGL